MSLSRRAFLLRAASASGVAAAGALGGCMPDLAPATDWTCTRCEMTPGQYGDTLKITYDYIDDWLAKPGRF